MNNIKKDVKILFHIHIIIKSFFSIIDITTKKKLLLKRIVFQFFLIIHIENEAEKKWKIILLLINEK